MSYETIPITEIKVLDRQRLDLGDITGLAQSLSQYGLIQPIVLNQEKRLIAGGRRLAAALSIGWTEIPFVLKETLSSQQLHILELEENLRRKDMDWRETCLSIAYVHSLQQTEAALDSRDWGQRQTGEMLGVDVCTINWNLAIAKKLKAERNLDGIGFTGPYSLCENLYQAWRLKMREEIDELEAEAAKRLESNIGNGQEQLQESDILTLNEFITTTQANPDLLAEERARYESNPLNKIPFDEYWAEKQKNIAEHSNVLYLSRRLILGDSITFMEEVANSGRFDHIITDIPYGIDIENIDQQVGIDNIDTIKELHEVEYNVDLIKAFFPAAFKCTKEHAFVVTFCDYWLWRWMADLALAAGFVVQRWPAIWVKPTGLNQCADFNFTKNHEAVLICRKRNTTLVNKQAVSTIHAQKDDLCAAIDHPFAKPFDCWKFLVEAVSLENQLILEPFAGRGSGVISMLRLKRNVVGVEKDETHYNALLENVKQFYLAINPNFTFK